MRIKTDGKYNTSGNRISYKANGKFTCYGGNFSAAIGGAVLWAVDMRKKASTACFKK